MMNKQKIAIQNFQTNSTLTMIIEYAAEVINIY